MSFPYNGAYFTFRLDPEASLQDLEDDEVTLAARRITPKFYVACTTQVRVLISRVCVARLIVCRQLVSLNSHHFTKRRTWRSFNRVSHLTSRRSSSSLGCVFLSVPTPNTQMVEELPIAVIRYLGMGATMSLRITRACGLRQKSGRSTPLILWVPGNLWRLTLCLKTMNGDESACATVRRRELHPRLLLSVKEPS